MKKLIEILESTCFLWLPIVAIVIASKLAQIITGAMIMKAFMVIGVISVITVILIDRRN